MSDIVLHAEHKPDRPSRRYRRPWGRWCGYAAIVIVALIAGALLSAYGLALLSIPDHDGEIELAGLSAPVIVARDEYAVARIEAANMEDATRALGYIHAQDRMFQMEMNRRVGAGRMAEILGPSVLGLDKLMRTLGLYRQAHQSVAVMSPAARANLEAYAQGVNGWIATNGGPWPPELLLLGIDPEPWQPADSVVWGLLMALQLSDNWSTEIARARLATRLTPEQLGDLWPPVDPKSPTTLAAAFGTYCCADETLFARLAEALPGLNGRSTAPNPFAIASASNEWVVSGAHTKSGQPLLANDPHLEFNAPLLWYLVEIVTPELTLTGASVPGVPYVLLGHNNRIAWGFTTTHADVQDLFIERTDPADPLRYLTPNGSNPFEIRREAITVRGRDAPEEITIRATRHGPVISDLSQDAANLAGEREHVALAFSALAPDNLTAEALFDLNRAQNWTEFTAALTKFHSPLQNIAYADTDGHIGFYVPGRLPMRAGGNGMAPVPGWTGDFDWTGFVPFEDLPHRLDPPGGRIVNANNRVVGGDFPHLVTADWPGGQRADRINELLDATTDASVTDFASMQNDNLSMAARELLPLLLAIVADTDGREGMDEALSKLETWNGRMDRNAPEPLIFATWLKELARHLYGDELGVELQATVYPRPRVIVGMLRDGQVWCDNINTEADEDCATIVGLALFDALAFLRRAAGDEIDDWRWGAFHKARFSHQIFGRIPVLRALIDIEIETDGGDFSINRGTYAIGGGSDPFTHIHGPGYRAVYDLSDLSNSQMIIATGQSGHPLSRHYADLTTPWRDGEYLVLGKRRIGKDGFPAATLVLTPKSR